MSHQETAGEDVCAFVAAKRFHQSLCFPSATVQKTIRVTFAIAGCQEPGTPTVLFAGGLYGGRWNALWIDHLCQQKRVRVVIPDRPGLGGSTPVALTQRIPVWLEMVPVLLQHLEVETVTLVAHSSGVIYLFNTLYHLPQVVAAPAPTVYLISPWVHPSKSGAKLLTIFSAMPAGLVSGWNKMTSFLVNRLMPSSAPTSKEKSHPKKHAKGADVAGSDSLADGATLFETCGLTPATKQPTRDYFVKMFFEEDTSGVAEEAKLGLKTNGTQVSWGVCDDYEEFAGKLAQNVAKDARLSSLRVAAYFGDKDGYVGKGGVQYFRKVWETSASVIFAEIYEIPRMNHDDLALPEHGVLGRIFDVASGDDGGKKV
ncbi:Alpha/beta hydrolase fold-1 domain-containing protein [Penicillium ucsense]|uniref:Alpha/beta hydrolase fold-1 domain-containing protein n=1 Tax=Penicillium ucsense TaxID=2839758 RepID=A0A8J8WD60_9EURO|nr:Alpha/beta hydrolase fold-1 domain-containing protein [Penicillium ucsense]KAF7729382.1 Alpha/beta hydrolase fold-1 domain-containing protein [Penicillium ucsense]